MGIFNGRPTCISVRPIQPRELDPEVGTLEASNEGSEKSTGVIEKTV